MMETADQHGLSEVSPHGAHRRREDCVAMHWEVNEWNRQAVEFYNRIGSTSVGEQRRVKEMTGEALIALPAFAGNLVIFDRFG